MAPRKATINKKSAAVAASKAKPSTTKKRVAAPADPLVELDRLASKSQIAILGERRDNIDSLSKKTFDFELKSRIPKILAENPNMDAFISGGSPQLSMDATTLTPVVFVILVPTGNTPPPFLAYSNAFTNEFVIDNISTHKLSWQSIAPRVSILKSTRRMTKASIRALPEDSKAMEEHLQLWTIIPSKKLQRNSAGKIDIRAVNFSVISKKDGKPIFGDYEKGGGLQDFIEMFVEEYEEELGEDPHDLVETAIREAFANERSKLEEQVERLQKAGFDEELLDQIKSFKIYPKDTTEKEKSSYINEYYDRANTVL